MESVPSIFNWVEARRKCSLRETFALLKEVVDSDVTVAKELGPKDIKFTLNAIQANKFVVSRYQEYGDIPNGRSIVFELTGSEIRVKRNGQTEQHLFSAKPSLNINGECLLDIDAAPYHLWQVSRKALEELFFGE